MDVRGAFPHHFQPRAKIRKNHPSLRGGFSVTPERGIVEGWVTAHFKENLKLRNPQNFEPPATTQRSFSLTSKCQNSTPPYVKGGKQVMGLSKHLATLGVFGQHMRVLAVKISASYLHPSQKYAGSKKCAANFGRQCIRQEMVENCHNIALDLFFRQ